MFSFWWMRFLPPAQIGETNNFYVAQRQPIYKEQYLQILFHDKSSELPWGSYTSYLRGD